MAFNRMVEQFQPSHDDDDDWWLNVGATPTLFYIFFVMKWLDDELNKTKNISGTAHDGRSSGFIVVCCSCCFSSLEKKKQNPISNELPLSFETNPQWTPFLSIPMHLHIVMLLMHRKNPICCLCLHIRGPSVLFALLQHIHQETTNIFCSVVVVIVYWCDE